MEARATRDRRYTVEEYLRREMDSEEKHDFIDGQIIGMAGGTARHSLIIANVIREVGMQLKGKSCRVYDSNLRVAIARDVRYSYPDLSILCDEPKFDPLDKNKTTIINPRVIIEVLSPATEASDRGEKFQRYLKLPSLEEYVLISQTRPRFESYCRKAGGTWLFSFVEKIDKTAEFQSLKIRLPLKEVYSNVEFDPKVK